MVLSLLAGRVSAPAVARTSYARTSYGFETLEDRVFMAAQPMADAVKVSDLKIPALTNQLRKAGVNLGQIANVNVQANTIANLAAVANGADALNAITGTVNALVRGPAGEAVGRALDFTLQQGAAGECPILDLEIGAIDLDLLGLVVETSDICLEITANEGEGLLGDLLCGLSNVLNGTLEGLNLGNVTNVLNQIIGGLNLNMALDSVSNVAGNLAANLTTTVSTLADSESLTRALVLDPQQDANGCAILDLSLGPINLNLLGLEVNLDNCEGGPVTVDITAEPGRGNLLGNLLCGVTNLLNGGLNLGGLNRLIGNLNRLLDRLDRVL